MLHQGSDSQIKTERSLFIKWKLNQIEPITSIHVKCVPCWTNHNDVNNDKWPWCYFDGSRHSHPLPPPKHIHTNIEYVLMDGKDSLSPNQLIESSGEHGHYPAWQDWWNIQQYKQDLFPVLDLFVCKRVKHESSCLHNNRPPTRAAWFGSKLGQDWQIRNFFTSYSKCTEIWSEIFPDLSHLGPIWSTLKPNWPCMSPPPACPLSNISLGEITLSSATFVESL